MAKFQVTVSGIYEVPDTDLQRIYGTIDLDDCAHIDQGNTGDSLLNLCKEPLTVSVKAVR